MILNFLKEISLETLRKNIEINLENYKATTNDWIFKFFDDSSPFLEFKKDVPQFNLDTSSERPEQTDLENVRILYSSMKHLSVVEAANENLWAGMAHSDFWDYVKYRNSFDKKEATENLIKNTFFFSHGKRKSLIMHPLARLWWTGHLVYDVQIRLNCLMFLKQISEQNFYIFFQVISATVLLLQKPFCLQSMILKKME